MDDDQLELDLPEPPRVDRGLKPLKGYAYGIVFGAPLLILVFVWWVQVYGWTL